MQTLNANKQLTTPDGTTFVVVESDSSNDGSEIVFEITMAPGAIGSATPLAPSPGRVMDRPDRGAISARQRPVAHACSRARH